MHRLTRLALMFLLAIALPLQGFAAATMVSCGLGKHSHAGVQEAAQSYDTVDAAPLDAHMHEAGAHSHVVADSPAGKADLAKGEPHKCSACASCCSSAAVPSRAFVFPMVKLTDHFARLASRAVFAYVSKGLERPPRESPV